MTLRELLDDTILRLGLCDRADLETLRRFLGSIEELRRYREADQQRFLQAQVVVLEPDGRGGVNEFASERHPTPAGGVAPYESLEIVREGGAG